MFAKICAQLFVFHVVFELIANTALFSNCQKKDAMSAFLTDSLAHAATQEYLESVIDESETQAYLEPVFLDYVPDLEEVVMCQAAPQLQVNTVMAGSLAFTPQALEDDPIDFTQLDDSQLDGSVTGV